MQTKVGGGSGTVCHVMFDSVKTRLTEESG